MCPPHVGLGKLNGREREQVQEHFTTAMTMGMTYSWRRPDGDDRAGLMERRAFIAGGVAALAAAPAAEGQQVGRVWRIGFLWTSSPAPGRESLGDLWRQHLHKLGYVEGQNVAIDVRYGDGRPERLQDLAVEFARAPVDIIVTHAAAGGSGDRVMQRRTFVGGVSD